MPSSSSPSPSSSSSSRRDRLRMSDRARLSEEGGGRKTRTGNASPEEAPKPQPEDGVEVAAVPPVDGTDEDRPAVVGADVSNIAGPRRPLSAKLLLPPDEPVTAADDRPRLLLSVPPVLSLLMVMCAIGGGTATDWDRVPSCSACCACHMAVTGRGRDEPAMMVDRLLLLPLLSVAESAERDDEDDGETSAEGGCRSLCTAAAAEVVAVVDVVNEDREIASPAANV